MPAAFDWVMLDGNGGIKAADGIKFTKQVTLRWGHYAGLSGGPCDLTGVFTSESRRQEAVSGKEM